MNTTSKWLGVVAVAFVSGSFLASPELRAFAANTVGSIDIIDESIQSVDIKNGEVKTADLGGNSVTAGKIKDGEVKTAEIGTDAVGADELAGVTKLLFGKCTLSNTDATIMIASTGVYPVSCNIAGLDSSDYAIATLRTGSDCFHVNRATSTDKGYVEVRLRNECGFATTIGAGTIAVMVYDK